MLLSLERRQTLLTKQKIAEHQGCAVREPASKLLLLGVLEEECQKPVENPVCEPS